MKARPRHTWNLRRLLRGTVTRCSQCGVVVLRLERDARKFAYRPASQAGLVGFDWDKASLSKRPRCRRAGA